MFAIALLMSAPAIGAPLPIAQAQQVDPARREAAMKLVKTVRSEAYVLAEAALLFDGTFAREMQKNEGIAALETAYPGVTQHMVLAVRTVVEKEMVASVPELWESMATIYASEMTVAELDQARAYYESASGRRLLELTIANMDIGRMMGKVIVDPDAQIGSTDIRAGVESGVPDALRGMTAEDRGALMRFAATPAFTKISGLSQRLLEASSAWSNKENPKLDAEIATAMERAVTSFTEAADKKKASK
jgi:hypothetical protein